MPDTPEKRHSHLEMPRSPVSCSTDSSRRDSLKRLQPEKDSEPPTPNSQSPPFRLTRKRAASIDTESANHPRIGDLALSSASSTGPRSLDAAREQVCLCQPDPKIPRPRNAFILYRQHYQAQVVTQNPGLANPEISKIIGEKWRETAPEVKNDWKRLAEEEKQRHQRQYPGYRYQPRRAGKPNGTKPPSASSSSSDDPIRCPKCNGRYISTPTTPMTPFTPAFGSIDSRNDRLLPPFTPGAPSHIEEMSRFPAQGMDSPHNGVGPPQAHRRGLYPPPQPLHTLREREEDLNMSPDQKRRRFNDGPQRAYPSPSSVSYSGPQTFPRNGPSMPPSVYRGPQQFPGQGSFSRSTAMAPPQQSPLFQQQPRHPYPTRANTFDESLRLPPLQTQLATPVSVSTARLELRPESRESQARSVEAMVMTIPYLNKIKVLSKISGPLRTPGPTSPSHDIRGAIIAVEGADSSLVSEVGAFLNEALSKEPSLAIKTWTAPPTSTSNPITPSTDTEMADEERKEVADDSDHDPFIDYLTTISKWHKKSEAIQKHITSTPAAPPIDPGVTKRSSDSAQKRLPVALLPEGFSITTSDHFALRIPINDAYAPVDHWQWMATLWRGIVGPDLTVYVKKIRDKDEFESMSGVELRKDCAAIVVRVMDGTKLDEKSARRLAFEVSEYVRGVEGSFGRA